MDYEAYRESFYVDPVPLPRFAFVEVGGATLYFVEFDRAVDFYTRVLGDPSYVEGEGTRGWRVGRSWLTLLSGGDGAPRNAEVGLMMETPAEAEKLQAAIVAAGGAGAEPSDQLMYVPIRACPATDPFGTALMIYAPLQTD